MLEEIRKEKMRKFKKIFIGICCSTKVFHDANCSNWAKVPKSLLAIKIFILSALFFLVLAGRLDAVDEWKGTRCGIKVATQMIVTRQEEWENLWKEMGMTSALPKINFRRRVVVGIFSGEKPTAGFSVEIKEVKEKTKRVTVYFKEQGPLPIQAVAQVFTQPYVLRVIQRPGKHKKIFFEQR